MKTILFYEWMSVHASVLIAMTALADEPATTTNPVEKIYSGTIASVDQQESLLVVTGFVASKTFNLGSGCVYLLLDKSVGTVRDLRAGQKVKVNYQDTNGVLVANQVEQQPQIFQGQVTAIDPTNHTFTVSVHWLDKVFQISSNCAVVLHNNKSGSLADIQKGGHVTATYETLDNVPTAWRIAQTSDSYTGTLTAIDLSNRIALAPTDMDIITNSTCVTQPATGY